MELNDKTKLAIFGLGYVGLPLALEFSKHYDVFGFDTNAQRVNELEKGIDTSKEFETEEILNSRLKFTNDISDVKDCDVYIIAVPTPVTSANIPDLTILYAATDLVSQVVTNGNIVIFESTVYPGCTLGECAPLIEKKSGLKLNEGFYCGYSPERINPGDKERGIADIVKVVSGSCNQTALAVKELYETIISVGVHLAETIEIAEAAKVIENIQRDLNVALVNELSIIFDTLNIDTLKVLAAAETKWNFLPFKPGLVGGHCIGVDPYYLAHKAQLEGVFPELILAGRRVNESIPEYAVKKLIKKMVANQISVQGSKILVLGYAFKENCPDTRNTKVAKLCKELHEFGFRISIHDPVADITPDDEHADLFVEQLPDEKFDAVILAVAHDEFKNISKARLDSLTKTNGILYDLKGCFEDELVNLRL